MAFPKTIFPSELSKTTRKELDIANARAKKMLANQHKANGAHGDVTADSLLVTGDVEIDGSLVVEGDTTTTGNNTVTGNETITGSLDVNGTLRIGAMSLYKQSATKGISVSGDFVIHYGDATATDYKGHSVLAITSATSTPRLRSIQTATPDESASSSLLLTVVNDSGATIVVVNNNGGATGDDVQCPSNTDFSWLDKTAITFIHGGTSFAQVATWYFFANSAAAAVPPATTYSYALSGTAGGAVGSSFDPADSTTYFYGIRAGADPRPQTTADLQRVYMPKAGRITYGRMTMSVLGTLGTTEAFGCSIRLNNTTDTAFVTLQANVAYAAFAGVVNITVAQGDYIEFKTTTPAWATNPTDMNFSWELFIET